MSGGPIILCYPLGKTKQELVLKNHADNEAPCAPFSRLIYSPCYSS